MVVRRVARKVLGLVRASLRTGSPSDSKTAPRPPDLKPVDEIQAYWRNPADGVNDPEKYLEGAERSALIADLIRRFGPDAPKILELGCNVGRNLDHLRGAGYTDLSAVEVNAGAIEILERTFPETAAAADIRVGTIEAAVDDFAAGTFDVVFTMAVLEHLHPDSEWVFEKIARLTKHTLIAVEDERGQSWRHFPRNYEKIFSDLDMTVVHRERCDDVQGLGSAFYVTVARPRARNPS